MNRQHELDPVIADLYAERARLQVADRLFDVLTQLICFLEGTRDADLATADLPIVQRYMSRAAAVRQLAQHIRRREL